MCRHAVHELPDELVGQFIDLFSLNILTLSFKLYPQSKNL
jgi:hypothetical protein